MMIGPFERFLIVLWTNFSLLTTLVSQQDNMVSRLEVVKLAVATDSPAAPAR